MKDIISIEVIDREGQSHMLDAPTDMGMSLMEICKSYELPVQGTCGGMALCSTCHVYVLSDTELPVMEAAEEDMLDQAFFVDNRSRLGCQLKINDSMNGMKVKLAPEAL